MNKLKSNDNQTELNNPECRDTVTTIGRGMLTKFREV